jgi:hypothetical protein
MTPGKHMIVSCLDIGLTYCGSDWGANQATLEITETVQGLLPVESLWYGQSDTSLDRLTNLNH